MSETPTDYLRPGTSAVPTATAPAPTGWICPVCGRGNAPYVGTCPCRPLPMPPVTAPDYTR